MRLNWLLYGRILMDAAVTLLCDNSRHTANATYLYTHRTQQDNVLHFSICISLFVRMGRKECFGVMTDIFLWYVRSICLMQKSFRLSMLSFLYCIQKPYDIKFGFALRVEWEITWWETGKACLFFIFFLLRLTISGLAIRVLGRDQVKGGVHLGQVASSWQS